jgi:peptide-methionine (S)-S-oxide reductase
LPGVIKTTSGYTGGIVDKPRYEEVSNGKTGHYEAVEVIFNPKIITYEKLLETFWHNIDPFDNEGQFCDKGTQYQAVIFYQDENQKQLAESSKQMIDKKLGGKEITTSIKPAGKFYPAEDYHQDYYLKNPYRYKFYRYTCERDRRLEQIWG